MSKLAILSIVGILMFKFSFRSPTTMPKTCFDHMLMRSVCVCQTFGTASKDYSVLDNGAKNLFKPYFLYTKFMSLLTRTIQSPVTMPKTCSMTENYKIIFSDMYVIICKLILGLILCKCTCHTSNKVDFKTRYNSHEDLMSDLRSITPTT